MTYVSFSLVIFTLACVLILVVEFVILLNVFALRMVFIFGEKDVFQPANLFLL
jgi:hypothetical protein